MRNGKAGYRAGAATIEEVPLFLEQEAEAEHEAQHEQIDDQEWALEELISALHGIDEVARETPLTARVRRNEFTCRSCFLVLNRRQVSGSRELICRDCARITC